MLPSIQGDRILVRLEPGIYHLDLDPVGFPPDWQTTTDAYTVDVVAYYYHDTFSSVSILRRLRAKK
ncbi:MAG: hypothetical protein SAK29_35580 [Scytonema sp. PMC 1069.18]|nr:hypothetical protein [Scytonema sp. PMC 1069.18]MEC4881170.1 hypothetical protein [Scytonema sp. PMC 1070.18]